MPGAGKTKAATTARDPDLVSRNIHNRLPFRMPHLIAWLRWCGV
jgi:hypothetical protein